MNSGELNEATLASRLQGLRRLLPSPHISSLPSAVPRCLPPRPLVTGRLNCQGVKPALHTPFPVHTQRVDLHELTAEKLVHRKFNTSVNENKN